MHTHTCIHKTHTCSHSWAYDDDQRDLLYPLGTTIANTVGNNRPVVTIEFLENEHEIQFPDASVLGNRYHGQVERDLDPKAGVEVKLARDITLRDPLYQLTEPDKELLRKYRVRVEGERVGWGEGAW